MFVKELGKIAGVPSVYTLPFCMLGNGNLGLSWVGVRQNDGDWRISVRTTGAMIADCPAF